MKGGLQKVLQFAVASIGVFSLLGYFGRWYWRLELANHFRVQYLWGATLGLLLLLLIKRWRWSFVAVILVALNAVHVLPWYFPAPVKVSGYRLKLLLANVKHSNDQYEKLIAYVKEEAPDIATFPEVNKQWAEKLTALNESLPYAKVEAEELGSGLALYSKIKLESAARDELGLSWRPGIQVSFKLENTLVHLLALHPPTPTEAINFPPRNQQFQAATERLRNWPAPKILIGDLNDTMWSSYHSPMMKQANLVNARQGHGIVPSWPAWLMFQPLMIPIDHCLVSPEIVVVGLRAGKNIGSDHLPLIVELVIPKNLK
jgi:endonuclease/exonuclease/phosphatase (EEP) superfamily protein YafD